VLLLIPRIAAPPVPSLQRRRVISRSVGINHATVESHCRRTSVVLRSTVAKGRVIADRAVTNSQRGMIVVDAATIQSGLVIGVSVSDRAQISPRFCPERYGYATLRIGVTQIRRAGT